MAKLTLIFILLLLSFGCENTWGHKHFALLPGTTDDVREADYNTCQDSNPYMNSAASYTYLVECMREKGYRLASLPNH